MKRLTNRVAIITGAARGIGKATAELFAAEGARIAVWDINEAEGQKVAAELNAKYVYSGAAAAVEQTASPVDWKAENDNGDGIMDPVARFYQVNTTDLEKVTSLAAEVANDFGRIDILINNAGITRDATLKKMTAEQWQQVIDVNLTGVFNCTKAIHPYMVERGYGRIVNAASIVGLYGNFGQTNYVATKSGVIGMTKVWGRELGRKGVTVNAVAPGFIATELVKTIPQKVIDMIEGRTPMGRLGEPLEIAKAYLFLASDDASFVNGTCLSVDGGLVM